MPVIVPGTGIPNILIGALVENLTETSIERGICDTFVVTLAVQWVWETTFDDAGKFTSVPIAGILANTCTVVVHQIYVSFVVAREGLLHPSSFGEDAGVIGGAVSRVGEHADFLTFRQAIVAFALAQSRVEKMVFRALVDQRVCCFLVAEEETGGVVKVTLEDIGFVADTLLGFCWVTDATSKI